MAIEKPLWDVNVVGINKTSIIQVRGRDAQEAKARARRGFQSNACREGRQVQNDTAMIEVVGLA